MLIGLTGKKQAGKDTVYERIRAHYGNVVQRASFADKLYESAAAALGVTVAFLQEVKSDARFRIEVTCDDPTVNGYAPLASITFREYLQRYGTEAHRQVFGTDFWVDPVDLRHHGRIVVVTDVRFENEARHVIENGGHVIRVVGPRAVEEAGDGHASEAPLPDGLVYDELYNGVRDDGFALLDGQVLDLCGRLMRNRAA